MEDAKVNGDAAPTKSTPADGAAKSVINIQKNNVTIISTGKDGKSRAPKVTTTPFRATQDPTLTSGAPHVSARVRDTQLVSALTQQFQANGTLTAPTGYQRSVPTSSTSSSRASHSRSSSCSSSSTNEDLTSKLSSMLLQQQQQQQYQQQQYQQKQQQQQQQQQQNHQPEPEAPTTEKTNSVPDPPSPSALPHGVNGGTPGGGGGVVGAGDTNGRDSGASSPEIPPPPPPSALVRSISEQPALRKVDASYTPRPKSYSTQSSNMTGNGSQPVHNKNDLMAALTAVVTSGSAVSGLRKTRGPGRVGGVTEVYTSKKSSGTSPRSAASNDNQEK